MAGAVRGDRSSVERLYPREAHDRDAAENARPKAIVHHGVRIIPAPDGNSFDLVRASRQVGEAGSEPEALFLFPVRIASAGATTGYEEPGSSPPHEPPSGHDGEYEAFITRVIEAAESAEPPGPIGEGEERLHGFHGG